MRHGDALHHVYAPNISVDVDSRCANSQYRSHSRGNSHTSQTHSELTVPEATSGEEQGVVLEDNAGAGEVLVLGKPQQVVVQHLARTAGVSGQCRQERGPVVPHSRQELVVSLQRAVAVGAVRDTDTSQGLVDLKTILRCSA